MTKLGRVVALQVTLISIAVAAGIYITNTIIEDFLITEALENEAAHFLELYQENPDQPLPNTANMRISGRTKSERGPGRGQAALMPSRLLHPKKCSYTRQDLWVG